MIAALTTPDLTIPAQGRRRALRVVVRTIAAAAGAAYLFGELGKLHWLLDLFSHFQVQYGAVLLIAAVLLVWLRDGRIAIAAAVAALWIGAPIARGVLDSVVASQADAAGPAFKVVTLNAWFRNSDTARIGRYLSDANADVVLLQEFKGDRVRELAAALSTYPYVAFTEEMGRHGAAILSRWPIEATRPLPLGTASLHAQWAAVRWHSTSIQVVAVHLPWPLGPRIAAARDQELHALAEWLRTARGPIIVGGDFNISPWSSHFADAVAHSGMRSALERDPTMHTWPTHFAPLGIQIDHCFVSSEWSVVATTRGPNVGSDHYPVEVELQLNTPGEATLRAPVAG